MLFTVFTPTYNRAYSLRRLYESLKRQSFRDFEWLIVDDGSSDNTSEIIEEFIKERFLAINYIYQANGGKHRAINKGALHAKGELFFIVDSDDYLPVASLQIISDYYAQVRGDSCFAGVCGLKCYEDGEPTGGYMSDEFSDWRPQNRIYRGDMAEVFKSDIIRKYPFPDFEGEKFCPEVLVWNRIGENYLMRYFNKCVYICEYLPDGLSRAIVRIRIRSPKYASETSRELLFMDIPIKKKLKESINFWRFYPYIKGKAFPKIPLYSWLMLPLGIGMLIKDLMTIHKDKRPQRM